MATRTATASSTTTSPRLLSLPSKTSSKLLTTPTHTPTSNSTQPALSTLWWNLSLPPDLHTPTCPSYLLYAVHHPKELSNLTTPDALFTRKTWPEVRSLIAANRLDQFTRVPSELRQYRKWTEGGGEQVWEYDAVHPRGEVRVEGRGRNEAEGWEVCMPM